VLIASVKASTQKASSIVVDNRHDNPFLECQSMIATKFNKP